MSHVCLRFGSKIKTYLSVHRTQTGGFQPSHYFSIKIARFHLRHKQPVAHINYERNT